MKDSEKKVRKPVRRAESKQGKQLPSKSEQGQKQPEITPEGLQALMKLTSAMYEAAKTKQPTAQMMKQFQITLDNIKAKRLS